MTDRKRILVADDDADLLDFLKAALTRAGYDVATVDNGRDALTAILSERGPDLVLLDVMLPYVDGYHIAQEAVTKLGDKTPPIMILSCRDAGREKGIALMSGAIDFVQKPFEIDDLQKRVERLLSGAKDGQEGRPSE
jgi:DNA-binding response OmpR family regulator